MVDANSAEKTALDAASDAAGQFMEAQVTTDLAQLPPAAWFQLIEVIIGAYVEDILRQQREVEAALQRATSTVP